MLRLNDDMVQMLYPEASLKTYYRELNRFLTSDVVVGVEVVGESSIERMKQLVGSTNPNHA